MLFIHLLVFLVSSISVVATDPDCCYAGLKPQPIVDGGGNSVSIYIEKKNNHSDDALDTPPNNCWAPLNTPGSLIMRSLAPVDTSWSFEKQSKGSVKHSLWLVKTVVTLA